MIWVILSSNINPIPWDVFSGLPFRSSSGATQPRRAISWQPLHTPRLNVSSRSLNFSSCSWTLWLNNAVAAHPEKLHVPVKKTKILIKCYFKTHLSISIMFDIQWFTVEREKFAPFSLVLLWQIQAVISLTTQFCLGNSTPGEIVCQCKKVGKKTGPKITLYTVFTWNSNWLNTGSPLFSNLFTTF